MLNITRALVLLACLGSLATAALAQDTVRPSVVKVHTTKRLPHPFQPWTKQAPQNVTGSGVVIDGERILTNAHVVSFSREIYVQGYQSADRVEAKVIAIAPGMDLAIIEPADKAFFKDRPPLPLAEGLPKLKETVNAYGYPTGGQELSVTEGIISRVEVAAYRANTVGLRIQVDAALNPGNSGGPAIVDKKILGIVFSGIPSADNIGYLIPADEIRTFLEDIKDGKYDGKPNLFAGLHSSENPALRDMLKLDAATTGIIVTNPQEKDSPLQRWDLITHVGEHSIDNEGRVSVREDLRLRFEFFVPKLAKDGKLELSLFRKGEKLKVQVPVKPERDWLVPTLDNDYPRYFIYGPLVFTAVTQEFVGAAGGRVQQMLGRLDSPLATRIGDIRQFDGEELVCIAAPMFSHKITKGLDNPVLGVIADVNGVKIKSLRHLVETLRDSKEEFIVLNFADSRPSVLTFKRKEILAATEDILTDNGIREPYSKDLRDAWVKE